MTNQFNKWLMTLLLLFIDSCKNETLFNSSNIFMIYQTDSTFNKKYSLENKLISSSNKMFLDTLTTNFVYYNNIGELKEIKTKYFNYAFGNYFFFYENGNLQSYTFQTGNKNYYRFGREYNSNGILKKEEGTPFVLYFKEDYIYMDLFFTTLFHDNLKVEISNDNQPFNNLNLIRSYIQPMLLESQIPNKKGRYYLHISGKDKISKKEQMYNDTLIID